MKLIVSLLIALTFFVSNVGSLFAQEMAAPAMDDMVAGGMGAMGGMGMGGPGGPNLPPLIRAKVEGITPGGVLLHEAKKGAKVEFDVFIGHPDKSQKVTYKTIGMPQGAKLDLKENPEQNAFEGKFSWTPGTIGIHGFIVEANSDKGGINRLAVFVDVQ
ncbi:MAG: hypothetical protein HYR97_08925 [Candidatus Melainabacteria bacterium]|nr:hypothetical protein [Candidatus Melainabacteria bacterium]